MAADSRRSDLVDEQQPLLSPTSSHPPLRRYQVYSTKRHWKNVFVLSLTFTLCFTAYTALQNIQSSLNSTNGLGLSSLVTVYAAVIFSSLIAPVIIKKLGVKWTIVFSTLCYCVYSASNLSRNYAALIPASCLLGLAASPLWVAQGTYLTTSAIHVAELTNEVPETIINRFNGVLFAFFQSSQIWGNLISSFLLYKGFPEENNSTTFNCGKYVCGPFTGNEALAPDETMVQILFGIFVLCGMIAVILALLFLDPLPAADNRVRSDTESDSMKSLITSTLSLVKNYQMYLLIPIMIYSGVEQAFMFGDFTKSYVTCTQGMAFVGLVMIAYGIADVASSLVIGQVEKYTGRIFLVSGGALLHMGLIVYLLLWTPHKDPTHHLWQLFLVASLWGVGDAVWQTQISSIVGVVFASCQEPAFSNFRLWQAVGFCISFASSIPVVVCVWHKLIAIALLLGVSSVSYFWCEYRIRRQ